MTPQEFKTLRLSLNLTQRGMAKDMDDMNYRTIQKYESGERRVERAVLKLCRYMEKYGVMDNDRHN